MADRPIQIVLATQNRHKVENRSPLRDNAPTDPAARAPPWPTWESAMTWWRTGRASPRTRSSRPAPPMRAPAFGRWPMTAAWRSALGGGSELDSPGALWRGAALGWAEPEVLVAALAEVAPPRGKLALSAPWRSTVPWSRVGKRRRPHRPPAQRGVHRPTPPFSPWGRRGLWLRSAVHPRPGGALPLPASPIRRLSARPTPKLAAADKNRLSIGRAP